MSKIKPLWLLVFGLMAFVPQYALACACGCGVFDVGTGTMMPTGTGGTAWFEYDFMNQVNNWGGTSRAPAANNGDKVLRSDFFQVGGEYMFNRSWGVMGEVPYTDRFFKGTDDDSGDLFHRDHSAFGDIHIQGVYTGFSDNMSTGVTFGFKLPSGDFRYPGFDRDVQIGSGSTDLLFGAYHMEDLSGLVGGVPIDGFVNAQWDRAFLVQDHYRPGDEIDAATGVYYNGFDYGKAGKVSPLLQLIGSYRMRDAGENADPGNTGYTRLLISPGVEYDVSDIKLYGDVEFPIYQNVNGNQITAPVMFKFIVGYNF